MRSIGAFILAILVVGIIVLLLCLDYIAYRERFPHAGWWTYFFQ